MIRFFTPCLFACSLFACAPVTAQSEPAPAPVKVSPKIEIGLRKIEVPPPAGFVRSDGISKEFDAAMKNFFPPGNRLLAYYNSPEDHAALTEGRATSNDYTFNMQVVRSLENEEIGERTFEGARSQMKGELEKMRDKISGDIKKLVADGNEKVSKDYGTDTGLTVSDTVFLGIFEDSGSSLGFSMAIKVKVADNEGKTVEKKSIAAAIMAPVNGRLVNFYANAPYESEADRTRAEKAVAAWRTAVVSANPRIAGPEADPGLAYKLGKFVGAGVVIALIFGLVKLFSKKKPA